jgi:hypothetical protein
VHGNKKKMFLPESSPALPSSEGEGYTTGGSGVGEYFCPVKDCFRHREKGFSEGAKLYRHIRGMHPEVDVEEVKRLETLKRGERRGRWNAREGRRWGDMRMGTSSPALDEGSGPMERRMTSLRSSSSSSSSDGDESE